MVARHAIVIVSLTLSLVGCAPVPDAGGLRCGAPPGAESQVYELFFGRSMRGGGEVTDQDWAGFRDTVLSANLPDGYTVLDAEGAWRQSNPGQPSSGRTMSERTKVVVVALPNRADTLTAVNRVRAEYQTRFHQLLVGMIVQPGCAYF